MSRFHSYVQTAASLVNGYQGDLPLSHYLRDYFSKEKKHGSRDRKIIASACYHFFRAGALFGYEASPDNFLVSLFLCGDRASGILENLEPGLFSRLSLPLNEKCAMLGLDVKKAFPLRSKLSSLIDADAFTASLFEQPSLFLRARPGKDKVVEQKLAAAGISFSKPRPGSFELPNQTNAGELMHINAEAVVQDYSSQRVFDHLPVKELAERNHGVLKAWDCCSASGGKSILLYDISGGRIELTVSDIRESILKNASQRLAQAGVPVARQFQADLSGADPVSPGWQWPLIMCDAPCTGSGTWSRTPEQIRFTGEAHLARFLSLQQSIIDNSLRHLEKGGLFCYITCSVFEDENEKQVATCIERNSLKLEDSRYITGYGQGADTMFVALLRKP